MDEDFEKHPETFEKSDVVLSIHMSWIPVVMTLTCNAYKSISDSADTFAPVLC